MFCLPLILFFNAELTIAIFHWSGGLQASTICLNTLVRDGAIDVPAYFKRLVDTASGPVGFFTFNLKIFSSNSFRLIVMLVTVGVSTSHGYERVMAEFHPRGQSVFSATVQK